MEEGISKRLDEQDKKLEEIYRSVEKTRKYLLWTLIATLAFFVLPLIGMIFLIPTIISTFSGLYNF